MTRIHFVGIGGSGLSAIAQVALESGDVVSGSDQTLSPFAQALAARGATVYQGHAAEQLNGAELVIISAAIPPDNPEVLAAQARGLPVLKRADYLGQLMQGRLGVAVAGTHGKTTTTGLIAFLLERAGLDPTFIVGGWLSDYGTNARAGHGRPFVIEADEYDRMFLGLRPTVAVVTNVEHDHPDCYPTLSDMQEAFREFVNLLPPDGLLVGCAHDAFVRGLVEQRRAAGQPAVLYGLRPTGAAAHGADDYRADSLQVNGAGGYDFLCVKGATTLGLARNRLPGEHNVLNSLAALAVADHLGVDFNSARNNLAEYRGAGRRFEVMDEQAGITWVDDYAHHPTEIRATLAAARRRFAGRPLWAMFQPHTYSRTRALLAGFAAAFDDADHVVIVDIYRSREAPDPGISAADIVRRMDHPDVRYLPGLDEAQVYLYEHLRSGDVLLTLGAGDGNEVGRGVMQALAKRRAE